MKKLIVLSIFQIVFLQLATTTPNLLATYEENKKNIFNIVKEHSKKYSQNLSPKHKTLIKDLYGITHFKMTQIPISQLKSLKSKYGLPQELVNQLSNIQYSDKQVYNDVKFHSMKGKSTLDNIFGIAKREQNNEIFFAYIRGKTTGQLIPQYITVKVRHCHKVAFVIRRCKTRDEKRQRGITANELDIIKKTLENKFYSILDESMNMDKKQIYKIFRNHTNKFKINYPKNWEQILDSKSLKVTISYKTKEILINNIQKDLTNLKIPNNIITKITQLKENSHIDFSHVFSQNLLNIHSIYGVVLKTQKSIILSYIIGKGEVNINPIICQTKRRGGRGFIRIRDKDCNKIILNEKLMKNYKFFINVNPAQIKNTSKAVFLTKFIEQLKERLNGLDF